MIRVVIDGRPLDLPGSDQWHIERDGSDLLLHILAGDDEHMVASFRSWDYVREVPDVEVVYEKPRLTPNAA